jgi:hypothetical protein
VSVRSRRAGIVLLAVGAVMVLSSATVAIAQTGGDSAVGFFDVTGEATGIGASFGDPTTQPYPDAAGLVPNTLAELAAGPSGQAQASILWPGPLLGNAGSLANVIGTPLPPDVVANLNDPVVARANAAGGGRDDKSLGPMHAVVDGTSSTASADFTDFNAPGVVSAARVVTESVSSLDGGKVTSTATSELEGLDIGGVLEIGHVRTVASGSTDGVRAATTHEVEVTGATVNGQAATIDEAGLHFGGQTIPVGPITDGVKPALDPFGLHAYVTKPVEQSASGGAGQVMSGAVVVVWEPPPPPDQFPDQLKSKSKFVVVLGGSSVHVSGAPSSDLAAAASPGDFFAAPAPQTVLPTPSFSPPAGSGAAVDALTAGAAGSAVAPALGGRRGPAAGFSSPAFQDAAAVSDRVPFGWVLIGIIGACLMATGMQAIRQRAITAAGSTTRCPLEGS